MNVSLMSLWLPIVVSAGVVFMASSAIWMLLKYHDSDWHKLPDEDAARAALKGTEPGQYSVPNAASSADRKNPEWQEKYKEGPAAMLVVLPHGSLAMGKQMTQWIVYCLAISLLVAYVVSITVPAGADYMRVFRIAGTVAVLTYAGAAPMNAIWFGYRWSATAKDVVDGMIYGLLTAGVFGWLWP
ncbi:MAG: hypothetical protein OEU90_11800 [Gammaproteobacteria bacterium]|nr:hypothetical protein [Gammaproteobacteria bacterium]MDH3751781.1 hypothetical protein [Gammaproteobacteria bacterium]MDH3806138.1 hypothetical protein [Gammaproteobacteria bacterium]